MQLGENERCHQSGNRELNNLDTARPKQIQTALFLDVGDETWFHNSRFLTWLRTVIGGVTEWETYIVPFLV